MSYITFIYDKHFVMIGDFNSRTGMIDDYLEDDELCDHNMNNINLFDNVVEFDSSVNHDNIVLNDRVNKYLIINLNGRKLIELCHRCRYRKWKSIGKDSAIGEYTCQRYNGKSTRDYALVPRSIFTHVTDFYAEIFDKSLSDSHSPICITISCNPTSHDEAVKPSDTVIQHPKYKNKWKPECTDIYTQSFEINEITTINDEIKIFVEHGSASQHEIDLMSNKTCDQFYKSGKIAGVCNKNTIPKKKFCKTVRRYHNKPVNKWFTPECENMRNEYMSLKNTINDAQSLVLCQDLYAQLH